MEKKRPYSSAFLGAVVIISHITFKADVSAANDYLRMLMFIVVAFVTV